MEHYKSCAGLNKQLSENLCDTLKNRVTYFHTRYHDVHNAYGRAAILLDGKEFVYFSWVETSHQENDISALHKEEPKLSYEEIIRKMKSKWDTDCTYCEMDFLNAVLQFRNMPVQVALESENYIVKILAVMDRRVGKRTLLQIATNEEYKKFPTWVRQFYELRLSSI
ncbi:SF0329 family protein [Caproiciproducens sp. R1]|uniref:SF0329 family protein n=1 Tax=Caproiciproducens sp. R1 TaxID=3435000 RepID=UPI0040344A03